MDGLPQDEITDFKNLKDLVISQLRSCHAHQFYTPVQYDVHFHRTPDFKQYCATAIVYQDSGREVLYHSVGRDGPLEALENLWNRTETTLRCQEEVKQVKEKMKREDARGEAKDGKVDKTKEDGEQIRERMAHEIYEICKMAVENM